MGLFQFFKKVFGVEKTLVVQSLERISHMNIFYYHLKTLFKNPCSAQFPQLENVILALPFYLGTEVK